MRIITIMQEIFQEINQLIQVTLMKHRECNPRQLFCHHKIRIRSMMDSNPIQYNHLRNQKPV